MKKRNLLFIVACGFIYATLSSYATGPAYNGFDCTGADAAVSGSSNPTGCSAAGYSCHGSAGAATAGITVVLELDSAGVATSSTASGAGHYTPGFAYTVKITGTNTTTDNLPYFGFQVAATKGAAATAIPVNAGTLQSTGLPAGLQYTAAPTGSSPYFYANVVEHSSPRPATYGTGVSGTTYVETFTWTAPAAGSGIVSIWGALNAVPNDSGTSSIASAAEKWNTNHLVLNEADPISHVSVTNVINNISVKAYPNPVTDNLNLQLDDATPGSYSIRVFDLSGNCVSAENAEIAGGSKLTNINTSSWAPGLYMVVIQTNESTQTVRVVKSL